MKNLELVQASGLRPAVQVLRRRGIDPTPYLERNGIPPEFIELPYAPLPKREGLWAFLEDVERSEGIDTLGFLMGEEVDLTDVGPFGYQISQSPTLHDAFHVAHHNISNFAQEKTLHMEPDGDETWVVCQSHLKTCRPADHTTLNFIISVIRLAAGPDWCPERARLQTGPAPGVQALPMFRDCEIEFNAEGAGVALPVAMLDLPLSTHNPDALPAPTTLTPLPKSGRVSDALRVIIATYLPFRGPPSAADAADMVGISRSTLFRRLAEEDTSYKELVEDVRYAAAQQFLANPNLSLKDISHLLGYSVPNNFIRAFRKVAGVTPLEFRREKIGA